MPSPTPIRLDKGGTVLLSLCELTPLERWQHYDIFPIKVVLHLALLLFSTWLILHDAARWGPYRLANQANVCRFFGPPSCAAAMCGATSDLGYGWDSYTQCFLYATQELRDAVDGAVSNYYNIQDIALANYGWMLTESEDGLALVPQPPILTATLQTKESDLRDLEMARYALTMEDLGPLDVRHHTVEEMDDFMGRLVAMQIELELTDDLAADDASVCYLWAVQVVYDVQNKAEISVDQKSYIKGFCPGDEAKDQNGYMWHAEEKRRRRRRGKRHRRLQQQRGGRRLGEDGQEKEDDDGTERRSINHLHNTSISVSSPSLSGRVYVDPITIFLSAAIFLSSLWLSLFLLQELHGSMYLLRRARALLEEKTNIHWGTEVALGTTSPLLLLLANPPSHRQLAFPD